jgi:hypothetical protein
MALNFPSSPTTGQTYTDDNYAVWRFDGVKWDVITSTTKKLFSGAHVELGTNFALTTTPTPISGGVTAIVPFDTDNYFRVAYPTRIYAPTNGFYRINLILLSASIGDGSSYTVTLKRNGVYTYASNVFGANQSITFDEILQLNAEDYVEVYASDSLGTGYIATGSHIEISRLGLTLGTGISSQNAFSGVRTELTSEYSTTSTPTPIAWDSTVYDQNADVLGSEYWNALAPDRITVQVTGYYHARCFVQTGSVGSEGSFTVVLKKNGTTIIDDINMSANDFILLNDTYLLAANDYLEVIVSNINNTGSVTTETYLELYRLGV